MIRRSRRNTAFLCENDPPIVFYVQFRLCFREFHRANLDHYLKSYISSVQRIAGFPIKSTEIALHWDHACSAIDDRKISHRCVGPIGVPIDYEHCLHDIKKYDVILSVISHVISYIIYIRISVGYTYY